MTTLDPRALTVALEASGFEGPHARKCVEDGIAAYLAATQPQAGEPAADDELVERLYVEMNRRFDQHKYDGEELNPHHLPVDDTQIGVEFAVEWFRTALVASPPPSGEVEIDEKWRELALQFDGHRIHAMCLLRAVAAGEAGTADVEAFLSAPPLPGEQVLADRIAALSSAPTTAEGWCQPMDCGKHTSRKFIVRFDDAERGEAVFDDEAEARAFWEKANQNWNCYLFGALPLPAAPTVTGGR